MDTETRAAFKALNETVAVLAETVTAGFARADRFFELQHQQHLELRDRLDTLTDRVDTLTDRVDALTDRVARLEREVAQLRDYVTREIGEIRLELRELRARYDQTSAVRREIAELTSRVDALERRQPE